MRIEDEKLCRAYYKALVEKDSTYLGTFVVGVKTTGIFCLPTCAARKPDYKNTEYFSAVGDALRHGYRPCKKCRPTEAAAEVPEEVRKALELMREHPMEKISDYQLRGNGMSPENIRRWFKRTYGITFQSFQRMSRINAAYSELEEAGSVTAAAMNSGYDSLSGFGYMFKKLTGKAPAAAKPGGVVCLHRFVTPLGPMYSGATDRGVCLLEFTDRRMLETELADLQKRLGRVILPGENEHTKQAERELAEYFAGTRQEFSVTLDTPGTEFQQAVWRGLLSISYGRTASYQAQAAAIGKPEAVRAVAAANGANRVAILIPCHRVIGKDGSLTGYGGGLERKRWLLEHEKNHKLALG